MGMCPGMARWSCTCSFACTNSFGEGSWRRLLLLRCRPSLQPGKPGTIRPAVGLSTLGDYLSITLGDILCIS